MNEIDEWAMSTAEEKCFEWFDDRGMGEVRGLYIPVVTPSKSKEWPPYMKININSSSDFFNIEGVQMDKEDLVKNSEVKMIVRFEKIYIRKPDETENSQKFRIMTYLEQVILRKPKPKKVKEIKYEFSDSESDEENEN